MTGTRKHYNDGFEGPPLEAGITWFDPGQSIEAGTGETEGLDAERESGGALQAQAPNPPVTLPIHGEMREALEEFCLSAECAAGVDEGADPDTASSYIMSAMGSAMAVAYDRARNALQGDGL